MNTFPISLAPYGSLLGILGKLTFVEAARMRQTCRQMDETIANSKELSFPLYQNDTLFVHLKGVPLEEAYFDGCVYRAFSLRGERIGFVLNARSMNPFAIQSAIFDTIYVVPHQDIQDLQSDNVCLPFSNQARLKCNMLIIVDEWAWGCDLNLLIKLFRPLKITWKGYGGKPECLSLPFEKLRSLDCKDVQVQRCDWLPPDYAAVLAQYKAIRIDQLEEKTAIPSLAPLIRLFFVGSPSPLRFFQLPFYERESFLSPSEIEELDLEKWRVRGITEEDSFVVDTGRDYITLTGHPCLEGHYCTGRRTTKEDVASVVAEWVEDFLPETVPYDASCLYGHVEEHRDSYEMVRASVEAMLVYVSSTYSVQKLPPG